MSNEAIEAAKKKRHDMLVDLIGDTKYFATDYSGRGMYGKSCVGIVTDDGPAEVVCAILSVAESRNQGEYLFRDVCDTVSNMSIDSMGRGSVYYWRSAPWYGEPAERFEDDEEEG